MCRYARRQPEAREAVAREHALGRVVVDQRSGLEPVQGERAEGALHRRGDGFARQAAPDA